MLALLVPLVAFVSPQSTPVQEAYIKASNTGSNDRFGDSVALSGDTLIVGALEEDSDATCIDGDQANNNVDDAGAAYVFVRSGTGWTQQAYLKSPDNGPGSHFAEEVAIAGDWAAVNGQTPQGDFIYVYERTGTTWSCHSSIPNPTTAGIFGNESAFALTEDYIVIGATLSENAAYVLVWNGAQWVQEAVLTPAPFAPPTDGFGAAVSASGNTVAERSQQRRRCRSGRDG